MSSNVQRAKEAFGERLRDIRKDAGLTGRELSRRAGWAPSKVSKIEHGQQVPTDDDIREWCQRCNALDQVDDLIATLRNIESQYIEWRRMLRAGTKRRQEIQREWEHESQLLRIYEPVLVPGILHTPMYARDIIATAISFYGIQDDLEESLEVRLARQDALYSGNRRFHVVIEEQALRTLIGDIETLKGQLGRLIEASSLSRLRLGIIPAKARHQVWPIHGFWIFDERMVRIETYTAEITVTQPGEISLYGKAFDGLARSAVYGQEAQSLILGALADLG